MERDTLYLIWKDSENNKYKVALLYKENEKFYFKYNIEEVKKAKEKGFGLLVSFRSINATYENTELFPVFASRLPEKRRPEIKKILDTYNMIEYDEFELLKRSKGKLPIDNYEFVQ